ncbi:MAG: hypothetical protein NWE98_02110 [Candidatus Bathyarchaeota archaeon]|nr:hypothetical protein [Candidatus Bathyarchaeota archaeon]
MTDIEVSYYNGSTWVSLSDYVNRLEVEECGIQKVSSAIVNTKITSRSNLQDFLSNPYRLMRIRAYVDGWQTLLYGYCNKPYVKTVTGTINEKTKMSLDVKGFMSRLSNDTKTKDYYALQSACTPYTNESISYREMLEDALTYPDSRDGNFPYGTGFVIDAASNVNGIDAAISGVANWENQTLFEIVRLTCEHIGYDGYYYLANESSSPTIKLFPFNKSSTFNLTAPFIGEPTWEGGALDDVANKIYLEGGVDKGVPSDGDRWTEYGYVKYNPKIWSATIYSGNILNPTYLGTGNIEDANNTVFNSIYRVGAKCLKFSTTNSSASILQVILNIQNSEHVYIDTTNRMTSLVLNLKVFKINYATIETFPFSVELIDDTGNIIAYAIDKYRDYIVTDPYGYGGGYNVYGLLSDFENVLVIPLNTKISTDKSLYNTWYQVTGSSFNWSKIKYVVFKLIRSLNNSVQEWGFYVDGLQFYGGQKISFFHPLNPPVYDQNSINTYGLHIYKHTDANVSSFEQAVAEKNRILNNLKNPINVLKVKKVAPSTQLYPSNVVTTNTVEYRINKIKYEWQSRTKLLTAEYSLIEKTSPLPPIWTEQNVLRYLIK